MTKELEERLRSLNDDQRDAVESIDGPLLVIAGPGTGKTQILSLRAANILVKRDVLPENILCLTFTEAGAEAMKKRLVQLIGREGYNIEVSTFHGFASSLRSRYPQYFRRPESAKVVSDLHRKRIVNGILSGLDISDPLHSGEYQGLRSNLGDVLSFLDLFKRMGLTSDEFRAIQYQTKESLDYLESVQSIFELAAKRLAGTPERKAEIVSSFESEVEQAVSVAPRELLRPVVEVSGVYKPYLIWLRDIVRSSELIDDDGNTSGFKNLKGLLFEGNSSKGFRFKDRDIADKSLSLMNVYDAYCQALTESNLYDFQDMISEAIEALSENPEMRDDLQRTYEYVQVDEFQDTNGSQMRIVDLLTDGIKRPNVMVVGDDDQAIMRFQGASVACIEQFVEKFDPKRVVLKVNYRSTPAIVDLGKGVACQIETRLGDSATEKDVKASKNASEQLVFSNKRFASTDIEYYQIAKDIRRKIDDGFMESCEDPDEAIAVIASKHASLGALLPYLRHFDIPFSYKHTANVLQMESMGYLLAVMRLAVALSRGNERLADTYVPEAIASRELGLTDAEIVSFAFFAKKEHGWLNALRKSGDKRIQDFYDSVVSWSARASSAPVRELVHDMAEKSIAYYRSLSDQDPFTAAEFNGGVRALLDFMQGEIESRRALDRPLRLTDIVDTLGELERFRITVDAALEIGRQGAIRLTSAHSSKGLEFDLVYILDADDDTWHNGKSGCSYMTSNVLGSVDKDEDDMRRLLFVALTRSKRLLEVYSGKGNITRELQESVLVEEQQIDAPELDSVIETSWLQRYSCAGPESQEVFGRNVPKHLSASALNEFVQYKVGCGNSASFPQKRVLRIPSAPTIATEFGTKVHSFLNEYLTRRDSQGFSLDELAAKFRSEILWMDFEDMELEQHAKRFDRIARTFVPYLDGILHGRVISELPLSTMIDGDVPLFGIVDLMLVDDDAKTIELIDFKTGLKHEDATNDDGYKRQLEFYKLLIEGNPDFKGYKVVRASDVFVEPEKEDDETIHAPAVSEMGSDGQEHLVRLIKAVWSRISSCDYDTSAFESSEEYKDAQSRNVKRDGSPRANMDRRLFQNAYEQWLIAHS